MHVGKKADQQSGYRPVYLRLCFHKLKKRFPYDAAQRKDAKLCQRFILLITNNNEHAKFEEEKESSIVRLEIMNKAKTIKTDGRRVSNTGVIQVLKQPYYITNLPYRLEPTFHWAAIPLRFAILVKILRIKSAVEA